MTRTSARGAIGELALLKGGTPEPTVSEPPAPPPSSTQTDVVATPTAEVAAESPAKKTPPVQAAPRRASAVAAAEVKATFLLPDATNAAVRSRLRPAFTGHPRSLSAGLLMQAYVRAIEQLGLPIDVQGLAPEANDQALARVVEALEDWKRAGR